VEAHGAKAGIGNKGELVINALPFQPGETVAVLILPKPVVAAGAGQSLSGFVLEYRDPFEPVE
jgi:hypothetical protein